MCIICYKPGGAKMPSKRQFKTMFRHNPDGAGFMYPAGGVVRIKKGFMTYSEFRQALTSAKDLDPFGPVVFHFRIATHGGVNAEMTQPFPLTDRAPLLRNTDTAAPVGVAHNGIIPLTNDARKLSDTAEFIRDYMMRITDRGRCFDDITLNIIEACISSRMAILTAAGDVHLLGHGWKKDGALYFSNDSYIDYYTRPEKKKKKTAALYTWGQDPDPVPYDDMYNWCDGYCSVCQFRRQCWETDAATDAGINSI